MGMGLKGVMEEFAEKDITVDSTCLSCSNPSA